MSKPATTISHSGQLAANTSSSSTLAFSAFAASFASARPAPAPPTTPVMPTQGFETMLASASGTIRSRSLSPAESRPRPRELAARPGSWSGRARAPAKLDERSVRWAVGGWRGSAAGAGVPGTLEAAAWAPLTSSSCSARMRRRACEGRYSLAYIVHQSMWTRQIEKEGVAHQSDETVRMERVPTWEHIELPRQQCELAVRTSLACIDRYEAVLQRRDVCLDGGRIRGRLVHFSAKAVNVRRVPLERITYLILEVVDNDKVGEEGEDVFDLQEVGVL